MSEAPLFCMNSRRQVYHTVSQLKLDISFPAGMDTSRDLDPTSFQDPATPSGRRHAALALQVCAGWLFALG